MAESLVEEPPRATASRGRPDRDLAKIAVVERHSARAGSGSGFVRGFGLSAARSRSTIAHDAHNIVVVGMGDGDMHRAVERLAEIGGGIVVVEDGDVQAELPLPVAGLLSTRRSTRSSRRAARCVEAARAARLRRSLRRSSRWRSWRCR